MASADLSHGSRPAGVSHGRWRRYAHLLVVLVGLAALAWGLTGAGRISCRGQTMHPGDVCAKSSFSKVGTTQTQTYEQRVHAVHESQPVIVVVGLALTLFGGWLAAAEWRKPRD